MEKGFDFIVNLGFKHAGDWKEDELNEEKKIKAKLNDYGKSLKKVLYAFVVDKNVKYVGKTTGELKRRMTDYRNRVSAGQYTNSRIRDEIAKNLKHGDVSIYALSNNDVNVKAENINDLITYTA